MRLLVYRRIPFLPSPPRRVQPTLRRRRRFRWGRIAYTRYTEKQRLCDPTILRPDSQEYREVSLFLHFSLALRIVGEI